MNHRNRIVGSFEKDVRRLLTEMAAVKGANDIRTQLVNDVITFNNIYKKKAGATSEQIYSAGILNGESLEDRQNKRRKILMDRFENWINSNMEEGPCTPGLVKPGDLSPICRNPVTTSETLKTKVPTALAEYKKSKSDEDLITLYNLFFAHYNEGSSESAEEPVKDSANGWPSFYGVALRTGSVVGTSKLTKRAGVNAFLIDKVTQGCCVYPAVSNWDEIISTIEQLSPEQASQGIRILPNVKLTADPEKSFEKFKTSIKVFDDTSSQGARHFLGQIWRFLADGLKEYDLMTVVKMSDSDEGLKKIYDIISDSTKFHPLLPTSLKNYYIAIYDSAFEKILKFISESGQEEATSMAEYIASIKDILEDIPKTFRQHGSIPQNAAVSQTDRSNVNKLRVDIEKEATTLKSSLDTVYKIYVKLDKKKPQAEDTQDRLLRFIEQVKTEIDTVVSKVQVQYLSR